MAKGVLLIGAILVVLSVLIVPWKITQPLKFAFQQELPEPNDLAGWKLYQSTTPGGPYKLMATIPFQSPQNEYQISITIPPPAQHESTLYFVVAAFDASGNESGYSNEVSTRVSPQRTGFLGYDFFWAGGKNRAANYRRSILQVVLIIMGTALSYLLVSRKKRTSMNQSLSQEAQGTRFYCETCRRDLTDRKSIEVHRAFEHDVKEIRG